ncbi:hypothetical protein WR25_20938 [Diploscapter pachys]|uniref:Uncharacterized protein n=1 Tax=Diploscapter pachys TaxID=2018661 RepID=A0A2A2KAR4_9BILA|nr:hypothetical protein WR25_20938 [Diploscapter pachys]
MNPTIYSEACGVQIESFYVTDVSVQCNYFPNSASDFTQTDVVDTDWMEIGQVVDSFVAWEFETLHRDPTYFGKRIEARGEELVRETFISLAHIKRRLGKHAVKTPFHDLYGMTSKFAGVSEKLVRKICNEKLIMKRRLDVEKNEKNDDAKRSKLMDDEEIKFEEPDQNEAGVSETKDEENEEDQK